MRFMLLALLLFLGGAGSASAAYPQNPIQWRPKDDALASTPIWGYDANGDIACPSDDGRTCIASRRLVDARSASRTLSCGDQMRSLYGYSGYDTELHWCRVLGLDKGNEHGYKWQPPKNGVPFYWRRNPTTGNIECASDGTHCYWWAPSFENAFKRTTVVACQPSDYTSGWCGSLASERRNNGYEWKLHQTLHYYRTPETAIDDSYYSYNAAGDIQCPSNDGITCFWPRTRAEAEAARQPLACGAEHQAKFGYNGYDTVGHWCRRFGLSEGNETGFTYPWDLNGLVAGVGSPDVMCASENAADCIWWAPFSGRFKAANPLVCGQEHSNRYGVLGYESADHWCGQFAATELRGHTIRIENTSGLPVQVCKAVSFLGEDRDYPLAEIRCSELAGIAGSATSTVLTVLPFPEDDDEGYLYQAVCVETNSEAGLFVGPLSGAEAQIRVYSQGIVRNSPALLDLSGDGTTCRKAFANFTYR